MQQVPNDPNRELGLRLAAESLVAQTVAMACGVLGAVAIVNGHVSAGLGIGVGAASVAFRQRWRLERFRADPARAAAEPQSWLDRLKRGRGPRQ